jgi:hypothetical protein
MASPIELPLVDISNSHYAVAGKKLLDAAVKHGFLYVDSNTTVLTASDVDRTFNLVREHPLCSPPLYHVVQIDRSHHTVTGVLSTLSS